MNTLDTAKKTGKGLNLFLMSDSSFEELHKAIEKHPMFPDRLSDLQPETIQCFLSRQREKNDTGPDTATGSTVFHEEWGEFLEAVQNGDRASARHELAQCIAMLLRIGIHLEDYMPNDKQD